MGKIDFYDLVLKTLENYDEIYNTESSLFKATYKDKLKISNKINSLLVSDISIWGKDNQFDFTSNIGKFLQISIDKIKYNKTNNADLNFRNFTNEKSTKAFNTRLFLNGYFIILKKALNGVTINTKIISQDKDSQYIEFTSNGSVKEGISFQGNLIYNTIDKTISHIVIEQIQDNSSRKFTSEDDKFKLFTNNVIVTYDFYKKDKLSLVSDKS